MKTDILWTRVGRWFGSSNSLEHRLAQHIDVEKLASTLKVDDLARLAAQKTPAEPKMAHGILQYFQMKYVQLSQEVKFAFMSKLATCDLLKERLSTNLEACEITASNVLARHKEQSRDALTEANRAERVARLSLSSFRQENKIAHDPKELKSWWFVGIGTAILFESVINAWAFAEGSEHGLMGGLWEAFIVVSINVLVAVAFGSLARNLFHVKRTMKALGMFTVVIYLAFLVNYTFLCAHYRDALAQQWVTVQTDATGISNRVNGSETARPLPTVARRQAVERFVATPYQVTNIYSILLIISSFGFACYGFLTGFRMVDKVPGYTQIYSVWLKRQRALLTARAKYLTEIDNLIEPVLAEVQTKLTENRKNRIEFGAQTIAARHLVTAYETFLKLLQSTFVNISSRYKHVFTAVGAGHCVTPETFMDAPLELDLHRLEEQERVVRAFPDHASELEAIANKVQTEIRTVRSQARAEAEKFFAETESKETNQQDDAPKNAEPMPFISPLNGQLSNGHVVQ